MSNRTKVPLPAERSVLVKSRRRCCLCFWLEGIDEVRPGQVAHLDQDSENSKEDNLCFLCLEHHDEYDTQRSQSKGLTKGEVKLYRDELYREIELRFFAIDSERQLRRVKLELREAARRAKELRADSSTTSAVAEQWRDEAASLLNDSVGSWAEGAFRECTEGAGQLDMEQQKGVQQFLHMHAYHLNDLADAITSTDLPG